jgi:hypothetical protein
MKKSEPEIDEGFTKTLGLSSQELSQIFLSNEQIQK